MRLGEKLEGFERFVRFVRFKRFEVWGAHKHMRSLCKVGYLLKCVKDFIGFQWRFQLLKKGFKVLRFEQLINLEGLRVMIAIY
jgi:hypothetical protein